MFVSRGVRVEGRCKISFSFVVPWGMETSVRRGVLVMRLLFYNSSLDILSSFMCVF